MSYYHMNTVPAFSFTRHRIPTKGVYVGSRFGDLFAHIARAAGCVVGIGDKHGRDRIGND